MPGMATSQELAVVDEDDGEDSGLTERQVAALDKLEELGAAPAPIIDGKPKYDGNPQIRALQLVYEGRFGGQQNGAGRKRAPRIAEVLADELRNSKRVKAMVSAIDRAMTEDAGHRANLDAIKLSVDLERGEATLRLKEEEHDELGGTKEELIATLFELVAEPATANALGGASYEVIEAEEVKHDVIEAEAHPQATRHRQSTRAAEDPPAARKARRKRDSTSSGESRSDSGDTGRNGRGSGARHRASGPNPVLAAKVRRSNN